MPADTCKQRLSSHNKQKGRSSCSNQEKQRALGALFLLHLPFLLPASFTDASQQPSRPAPATTTWMYSAPWAATRPITDQQQEKQGPDHPISNSPSPQTELETIPLPQYQQQW
ncbi:hypothetical protein NC653_001118 [Populus alba x Populus x berolinensis]|uniref:Uncharacterized protein n=1 Tax=Populus alba x Populus x berolinensis TaxID=444605 RepID=A0AAD6RKG2_9ROSI|nr:hypothetical protein NC653_001118 [Populus alba x Populus x berolinensis]